QVDTLNPLLSRLCFLAIIADNLDEFFAVRVAGLHHQRQVGRAGLSPDGMSAAEQLAAIRIRVQELLGLQDAVFDGLRMELAEAGIRIAATRRSPSTTIGCAT